MSDAGAPLRILPYEVLPASHEPPPPYLAAAADALAGAIHAREPALDVQHVGSSAVPGLPGKNVIDLAVVYLPGRLEAARDVLDAMGFQRQEGEHAFPEARSMRRGTIEWEGVRVRVHAHVIARGCQEHAELVAFRERLRNDPELCERYAAEKRRVLATGLTRGVDYAIAKGDFVRAVLRDMGFPERDEL